MPKVSKSKGKLVGNSRYLVRGWKNIYSSATSAIFTSEMPAAFKNNMIEASKGKKILSTGGVFVGFGSHPNGENTASKKTDQK